VRILFLGEISYGQTSLMRMRALQRLGHEVVGVNTIERWKQASWLTRQWQRRLQRGSIVKRVNDEVISVAKRFRPDTVWAEKQEFLRRETVEAIRADGAKLIHFTPDPYFSLSWKRTRLMDAAMAHFDVLVYCKSYERKSYEALGKPLVYMPLGFCDQTHRPLRSTDGQRTCDVGFLGGWEPRREKFLAAVAHAGVSLKVWGGYWDFLRDGRWTFRRQVILRQLAGGERFRIHRDATLAETFQGGEVYGDDYARALSGARIGLGLLRKVCPDQHTTRTFEIPACRSFLLADRTDEHQQFFVEGEEAEFFSSVDELVEKVRFYTTNESARRRIAAAGYERCRTGRYAYVDRLKDTLAQISRLI
jgi:spore maturation protein CgeB